MTRLVVLIGYPLEHSVSPAFQQAAFDYYQLDICYEAWEVEPAQLEATANHLHDSSVLGANVTIPYKEKMLPLLDELDKLARQIGAVNTIVNQDGKLIGYNTDAEGFLAALRREGGFEPWGKQVVLLGAGGVARAASFALAKTGVKVLFIVNRTLERAEALAASLKKEADSNIEATALPWGGADLAEALSHCDLLVNCTSVGMRYSSTEGQSPLKVHLIPKNALVYDLVYNPVETPLLKEAKKAGARTLKGLFMLVYQGAASLELWTGRKAPVDLMLRIAREALD